MVQKFKIFLSQSLQAENDAPFQGEIVPCLVEGIGTVTVENAGAEFHQWHGQQAFDDDAAFEITFVHGLEIVVFQIVAFHVAPANVGDEGQFGLAPRRIGLPQHSAEIVAQIQCRESVAEKFVGTHGAETSWRIKT